MATRLLEDDGGFDVTVLEPRTPARSLVFAAGRGGHPGRHAGLLQAFADQGFRVVAPHFDRLATPVPTREALEDRARRLVAAVARLCPPDAPLCGVGHSLGATLLLALGVDGRTVQQILGHSSAAMTAHYQHVDQTMARAALGSLGAALALPARP